MLVEEQNLITQLTQLSTKYRSKGLKFKDIKSVVGVLGDYFDDTDVFSDQFVVGLFSSLLDVCTLSASDKRSAVKLGEYVGMLLVKIPPDCVLWSVYQKCGIGILTLLEEMVGVDKSVELNDRCLHIQDGTPQLYDLV